MQASIAHGIRPTALILGKDSGKPWDKWDIHFAKAYQRFLKELCQQCGLPRYICHTDDNRIQFRSVRDECASARVSERAQEELAKNDNRSYGVRVAGEPFLVDAAKAEGMQFSDFRRPYMIERAKKMGYLPDDAV